ncbi:unnamed protein product [Thlaspi arvense]|uniref:Uncharacterized protein n=1 Tax=Thlaspi arvense TaxID=13288 RepID=A0AAU9S7H1_THLAR|nr:unnamed protein product [Thlaspi arvense]
MPPLAKQPLTPSVDSRFLSKLKEKKKRREAAKALYPLVMQAFRNAGAMRFVQGRRLFAMVSGHYPPAPEPDLPQISSMDPFGRPQPHPSVLETIEHMRNLTHLILGLPNPPEPAKVTTGDFVVKLVKVDPGNNWTVLTEVAWVKSLDSIPVILSQFDSISDVKPFIMGKNPLHLGVKSLVVERELSSGPVQNFRSYLHHPTMTLSSFTIAPSSSNNDLELIFLTSSLDYTNNFFAVLQNSLSHSRASEGERERERVKSLNPMNRLLLHRP